MPAIGMPASKTVKTRVTRSLSFGSSPATPRAAARANVSRARGRRSPAVSRSCPTAASLTAVGLRFERPFVYHDSEHAYAGDPGQAAAAGSGFLRSPGPACLRAAGTRPGRLTDRQAPGAVRRAARVLAPGEPDTAAGAGPGPLRQGIPEVGRPRDRRAAPGRSRPRAAAGRLRGRRAAAGSLPARPGRRTGAAALRLVMADVKDTDWAYAAGFVDGEGYIAISRSFEPRRGRFYYSVQIVVSNRDRDVLDWMQINWGGWIVSASSPLHGLKARQAWNWRTPTGQSARPFLTGIRPYLRLKIAQCENALPMMDLSRRSRRTLGRQPLP